VREEVWRHLPRERQMHSVRVAGTLHACCTGIDRRSVVRARCLVFVALLHTSLNLHALYHIPPRRACPSKNDKHSRATCGNAACAAVISSINDATMSSLKTGFTACAALPDSDGRKAYGNNITAMNYEWFKNRSNECGFPANTVKLTQVKRKGCYTQRCRAPAPGEERPNLGIGLVSMQICSSLCGNGKHDDSRYAGLHEDCDDGNIKDGDGCSSVCLVEPGWECTTRTGTCGKTTCHPLGTTINMRYAAALRCNS
jgi:cysteine-rich repeat protein